MKHGVRVDLPDRTRLTPELEAEFSAAVRRMLSIDSDLGEFYSAMSAHEGYQWLEAERCGRILACPSLWEDLAKVLLTTNCSWSQTINMARQLCRIGRAASDDPRLPCVSHVAAHRCHAF